MWSHVEPCRALQAFNALTIAEREEIGKAVQHTIDECERLGHMFLIMGDMNVAMEEGDRASIDNSHKELRHKD